MGIGRAQSLAESEQKCAHVRACIRNSLRPHRIPMCSSRQRHSSLRIRSDLINWAGVSSSPQLLSASGWNFIDNNLARNAQHLFAGISDFFFFFGDTFPHPTPLLILESKLLSAVECLLCCKRRLRR